MASSIGSMPITGRFWTSWDQGCQNLHAIGVLQLARPCKAGVSHPRTPVGYFGNGEADGDLRDRGANAVDHGAQTIGALGGQMIGQAKAGKFSGGVDGG